MAATPTPRPAGAEALAPALGLASPALIRALDQALPQSLDCAADPALAGATPPAALHPLAVAFSGGADSTALLRAACLLAPGRVQAFHIHHGLQDAADSFARHCVALCEAWGVPLRVLRVQARHAPGESPEDAARRARYAALAEAALRSARGASGQSDEAAEAGLADPAPARAPDGPIRIWLGQHADDQAETLLLALSRGAGLPGLAAMPARFERGGVVFERPFLSVPGADLRAWLQAQGIGWVEDPSNQDTGFTRNRIRHQLLPALEAAFPQFRETFARSARHAAQAQALLAQVAGDDLAQAAAEDGGLLIAALQALTRERQANLLRHWLRAIHGTAASAAQLEQLLRQVDACRTRGHGLRLRVGEGWVLREGEALAFRAGPGGRAATGAAL